MWLTEAYTVSDFTSVWHKQTELVINMPHKDNRMSGYPMKSVSGFQIIAIHNA